MCDCALALGTATARSATIFGKNSDRQRDEAQPLRVIPAGEHAPDARVRASYIEIPQAPQTARVLGSGPFWVWGLEHGVNEHGVVIGNESVFTHEELELPDEGLLGMDLVRLGLERARTAHGALGVITELIERYGQGGNGFLEGHLAYSNGFLIADPHEAWTLQTSARAWAARREHGIVTLSNHPSIGEDWDELGPVTIARAVERGWWRDPSRRFNFETAYRSTRLVPRAFSDGRLRRSRELLRRRAGRLEERDFFGLLRDHGGECPLPDGKQKDEERYYTLCAHNDVQQETAASLVVALDRRVRWLALGAPCCSVYLPLYLEGEPPAGLLRAGRAPDEDSVWWRFKRLQQAVESDFPARLPRVRENLGALEEEWLAWPDPPDDPTGRMEEATARALETTSKLLASFEPVG
ncbi:MAG: C69 family dipeptidase [Myxococcota bacterium]